MQGVGHPLPSTPLLLLWPHINSIKDEMAFWSAQWALSIDHCISCLFFSSLYFQYDFHNKYGNLNNSQENSFF